MIKSKEILITGFALFSLFFGAGNLILPPSLGVNASEDWFLVTFAFGITAVIIPIFGIMAHAKLQGTMYDFGKKVSPLFSSVFCFIVYVISIVLPVPRTASVTHEIAVAPIFDSSPIFTSVIYFTLVLVFALNRSNVLDFIGRFLTPFIILILLVIIVISLFVAPGDLTASTYEVPFIAGLLEGYQTFDALGAVVVGGVIIVSMNLNTNYDYVLKRKLIMKSGFVAGAGLFLIYGGLISSAALFGSEFGPDVSRVAILSGLSELTLGAYGEVLLSVLVALACFTTAVGIVMGTADYFKSVFKDSSKVYTFTVVICCFVGVLIGQFDVHYIIQVAVPTLMFIYPIIIALIFLNLAPDDLGTQKVFRVVILVAFIFSIPDFIGVFGEFENVKSITKYIPFANYNLGWVLPSMLTFGLLNFKNFFTNS